MAVQRKYLDKLRERTVDMVFELPERDGEGPG